MKLNKGNALVYALLLIAIGMSSASALTVSHNDFQSSSSKSSVYSGSRPLFALSMLLLEPLIVFATKLNVNLVVI